MMFCVQNQVVGCCKIVATVVMMSVCAQDILAGLSIWLIQSFLSFASLSGPEIICDSVLVAIRNLDNFLG